MQSRPPPPRRPLATSGPMPVDHTQHAFEIAIERHLTSAPDTGKFDVRGEVS